MSDAAERKKRDAADGHAAEPGYRHMRKLMEDDTDEEEDGLRASVGTPPWRGGWHTGTHDRQRLQWASIPSLLCADESALLVGVYEDDTRFRTRVVMARHGFGRGEYKYFAYPLPDTVRALRTALYSPLLSLANRWNELMGIDVRYPGKHAEFIERCHRAGQTRPTPLLLKYGAGDFNALHQDVYGEHLFPLQAMLLLSEPGVDFTGGEFVLVEQRPRMQSRAEVVPLRRGDAVLWAVRYRPVHGTRGTYRVAIRHGVSRLRSGVRYALGIIFHDAR